jgi:ATP-dependent helicase/nuclease subunit B
MNRTIQHLSEICQKHRFEEKLLFVPSYGVGHQVTEHLAKSGTPWINLRIKTLSGYANELVATDLSAAGITLIVPHERVIIIENLYHDNLAAGKKGHYFEGAAEIPGILKCLDKTLNEMRMAGLESEGVDPEAFIIPGKGEELVWLIDVYERYLRENKLIDTPVLLRTAMKKLQQENIPGNQPIVMVLSDFPLAQLEKDLISLAGRGKLVAVDHDRPLSFDVPARLFAPENPLEKVTPEPVSDIELLAFLFQPEKARPPFQDGTVSLFHALGESNEVREVFRRILQSGISLDDVEIMVTKTDPYCSLIYEIANSLEIPVTFAGGIPVSYSRPGRALILFLRWIASDFSASIFRRLVSGGDITFDRVDMKGDPPSPGRAAAIIREAAIGWGRERYGSMLASLAKSYQQKAREAETEEDEERAAWALHNAEEVLWLDALIREITALVPAPGSEGTVSTAELYGCALDFLQKCVRITGETDARAKAMLTDVLQSLVKLPSLSCLLDEAVERLKEILDDSTVDHAHPAPGSMHVSHYASGGYSGRSRIFVIGLDQTRFPGVQLQDPVILDEERERLAQGMVSSGELLRENLYSMARLLGSLRGELTLSYSCRDLREDRELFPSSLLLQVYRAITTDRSGNYGALISFLGKPAGFIPGETATPLNGWEWWLKQGGGGFDEDAVFSCYPRLSNGKDAEAERYGQSLGHYDGWIPSAGGSLDPLSGETVLSCSRLELLASCPFAYFVRYVLKIEPVEDMEKDNTRWLDPLQRGQLLHDVFCRFMETLKEKGEKPGFTKHYRLIEALAMEEIGKWRQEVPPASALAFDREVEEMNQTLTIFLQSEEERCKNVEPFLFELSFGMAREEGGVSLSEEPVEIKVKGGGSFKLRGRIDRLDKSGPHDYEVWDYKTGGTWGYKEESYINRGRHLQHALYGVAAEIVLKRKLDSTARVVRSGYFFPSPRGEGQRIVKEQLEREELFEVLEALFELLREGVFPSSYDGEPCHFCEFDRICGGKDAAVGRCKEKLESDTKLKSFLKLKNHG